MEGEAKLIKSKAPRRTDTRGLFWSLGVMYEEEGNAEARLWFCLAHAVCRDARRVIKCFKTTTTKCSDHLRTIHGAVSGRSQAIVDNKLDARQRAENAGEQYRIMQAAGKGERFYQLDFVHTFVVGEFLPFVFPEKRRVRRWAASNGACSAC